MHLACMWSISCKLKHLAHQQSQQKIQWSMLRKRSSPHYWTDNTANQHSAPPEDVIRGMKERKCGCKAELVRARGALHSLWSKKKFAAEKGEKTHSLSNEHNEKWINDYVDRETAVARKRAEVVYTAIKQEQDDVKHAENAGLTTRKPKYTFEEMLNTIGDSLSDLATSHDEDDGEDDENDWEDTELDNLGEDDQPSCVMGTISEIVTQRIECLGLEQTKLDESIHPGWGTWLTTSMRHTSSMGRQNWWFQQLLSCKW